MEHSAHFFQKNSDEILLAHYTWKVAEKGFNLKCANSVLRKSGWLKQSS